MSKYTERRNKDRESAIERAELLMQELTLLMQSRSFDDLSDNEKKFTTLYTKCLYNIHACVGTLHYDLCEELNDGN